MHYGGRRRTVTFWKVESSELASFPVTLRDEMRGCQKPYHGLLIVIQNLFRVIERLPNLLPKSRSVSLPVLLMQGKDAGERRAYLSNVCVDNAVRRRGVARKLIDEAKTLAKEWGKSDSGMFGR